ncbi:hypothetical protein GT348_07830 [Aristophania vespae]|uniref:Transglycosylase SLT domain-containing protein n=1 Tax=Aristophania vespae TaxID=2697033 RepID=A0A6P1NMT3_9PROT|nr:hypothetical protein [Aristophania vespae]QHI96151.1 hypothetical protein GT348_07830 [Aristophania vespae]
MFYRLFCHLKKLAADRVLLGQVGGLLLLLGSLTACATSPPAHPGNLCDIYREKRGWYHAAMRQERKWNIPSSVPMAMMYQESGFRSNVHTRRRYILWVIPWGYITTAYGYPQAKDEVWSDYEKKTGRSGRRDNYADALDFMNWYITNTKKINGVPVRNATNQYLAYHEGWGGYKRRSYASKGWLVKVARKVGSRASTYQRQFNGCKQSLKGGFWENLLNFLF